MKNRNSKLFSSVAVALLLSAPLSLMAQTLTPVFTDAFVSGSTTNKTSTPGGTPTASSTSYDFASNKTVTNSPASAHLKIALTASTGSGAWQLQAVFAGTPVALNTVGDFISLTYTFTNVGGLNTGVSGSWVGHGLYNSGGTVPVAGGLAAAGLGTSSTYASGNCQNWQGYIGRIVAANASAMYTRPMQTGTTSANQDLLGGGYTGAFDKSSPSPGTQVDATLTGPTAFNAGDVYTVSYTIALTAPQTLTITNNLYSGVGASGTPVFSQTSTTANTANTYLTNSFDSLAIGIRAANANPTMDIASIAVTKFIMPPGPSFNVTGGGTGCPGDAFAIGLSGSVSTNDYYLFTNTVWNGQVLTGTGSAITFGPENVPATYSVLASNNVNGVIGMMNGSATINILNPPVITNQPVAVVAANNYPGVFNVGASGAGLVYHWYKNGVQLADGGHIIGSGTPSLVIYPATSADAASQAQGYYCIITNSCGYQAISVTNSLTIGAPSSLVWAGNNGSAWDLATTANFTKGGNPSVFNGGDNVTLDDTASSYILNVTGSYVAPSTITESASSSYYLSGAPLIGPGSLVMNGTSLTISNANAYTGGSTLHSGNVVLRSFPTALGTGPVTFTGGTLEFPVQSSTGISNNVVVSSGGGTVQYDSQNTYGCVLYGALSGSSGTTLAVNLNNANVGTVSRMRLYGIFTNNANISLTSSATEIEFAPYNGTNGDQVYNGTISGTGGHIVARGSGNAVLAGQNTFDDTGANNTGISLLMSSGNIGFGASSVLSGLTIVSGPASTGNIGINTGVEGGNCSFFAYGGARSVANPIIYNYGTNTVTVSIGGSNNLTFSGAITLSGADGVGTNRAFSVGNTGLTTFSGAIGDNSLACGLSKTGSGTLALTAVNTYTGPTILGGGTLWVNGQIDAGGVTVTNGTLAGTGTILGPVSLTGGTLSAGTTAIGTLTVNNNLTLAANGLFKVNKSQTQSNDLVTVSGTLSASGTGTITVTNIGVASIAIGDQFTLFNKPVTGANNLVITGGGVNWTNKLAVDGSIQAIAPGTTVITVPPAITNFSLVGNNVVISGTNGQSGATAYLLMTTNLATPRNQWKTIATNVLGGTAYSFVGTNAVTAGSAQKFYILSSTNYNP